jgi:hypothetical protein
MDATPLVLVAILAVVCIAAFFIYRQQVKVKLKGPLGTNFELEAANQSGPAAPRVVIEDAKAGGGIRAEDKTGGGANIRRAEAAGDITATSESPGAAAHPKP